MTAFGAKRTFGSPKRMTALGAKRPFPPDDAQQQRNLLDLRREESVSGLENQ